jgi:hypothetical protein
MTNSLIELRKRAEESVREMPDGDLKVKAFETILAHLLARSSGIEIRQAATGNKVAQQDKPQSGKARTSVTERLLSLKGDNFFSAQRSIAEIRQELKKNGWHYPITSLSGPLQVLVQKKKLRRERVSDDKGRRGWGYSNP